MSGDALAAMWRSGESSHGAHRGQGLTESKRRFVESRSSLEVRSAEGVGTCVRVELPHRDVAIRPPRLWAVPPIVVPLLAILAGGFLARWLFFQADIVSVEVQGGSIVHALDKRGSLVWQRDLGEDVRMNHLGNVFTPANVLVAVNRHLVLDDWWPLPSSVVLATQPPRGPGKVWRLGAGGRALWVRPLRWTPPKVRHTGDLKCMFEARVPWNRGRREAIALNVRDSDWSPTSIQFLTPGGDSLGAYYHPGHLEYLASEDMDGDEKIELVLLGRNNRAREDRTFIPADPGDSVYISCLVMLEPPGVNGQAYPYTAWADMAPAAEEGYLLIPPIEFGVDPEIKRLDPGHPTAPGAPQMELVLQDGRIYHLDARLRPLSCGVGDRTLAAALAPTRAMGPLVYLHQGRRELIDLPIQREP